MKKVLINFHVHSTGSDGKQTPEEVIKEAINAGIDFMCFTDHYKQPFLIEPNWPTDKFHSPAYVEDIKRLQEQYQDKIDISFGAEFDWIEPYSEWLKKEISKEKYDYIIGSVHVIVKNDKLFYALDFGKGNHAKWLATAERIGGIESFAKEYYRQVRLLAKSGLYDSVGHFDLIKIYNKDSCYFSENSDWYKKEVLSALDAIATAKMAIEINIRGFHKAIETQYPSLWILEEARKRNIPITIGSDAHRVGEVGQDLDKAYELARKAGYKEIVRFKARKKISIPIV